MSKEFIPKAMPFKVRGKTYWRVRIGNTPAGNAKYDVFGTDKEKAEAFAKKLQMRQKAKRQSKLSKITEEEEVDFVWALDTLSNYGATIKEAAEWYCKTKFPEKGHKTVTEVGEIYLKHRKESVSGNTFNNYEGKIEKLSSYFGEKLINEVTTAELENFFDVKGKFWGPNTMNPWKKWVVFYFKWLQEKGYIHRQGFTAAHHMAIPKRNIQTPKLAQPYEASEMLYWYCNLANSKGEKRARSVRGCIVYLVLILFCGIRREEACQVKWNDIDLNGEKIKVLVEGAKKKKRRVNKAEPNVWYWFRYCKRKGADLTGFDLLGNGKSSDPLRRLANRQRQYRESFKAKGKPVPPIVETIEQETVSGKIEAKAANQNIMRHSFISYHMKLYNSAGKTSRVAGNSEREVENTYLELVEDVKDSVSWFAIYPPEVYEKIIDVPGWDTNKAFDVYLKLKFMRRSVGRGQEIADTVQEYEQMLYEWEQAKDENMNLLAEKIKWFDDPRVKWVDGKPMLKEIDLTAPEEIDEHKKVYRSIIAKGLDVVEEDEKQ